MTQISPETTQVDPDVEEQDQPETTDDAPRVYVVASDEHGTPLGGAGVEEHPRGVVSVPAALLGAGEVVSATAMTAVHLAGPGAAVAVVAAMGATAWGVRAHRAAVAAPATVTAGGRGRGVAGGGQQARAPRSSGRSGVATGHRSGVATGHGAGGRLFGRGRGRSGGRGGAVAGGRAAAPRGTARTTAASVGLAPKRAGRVAAGAARAKYAAGAPGRAARRAELAAARRVGGHTQAAARRAKATPAGRAATTAATRAKTGAGRVAAAGRRAKAGTAPARQRAGEARALRRERAQAIRKAVRRQATPGGKATAAKRAAREFDKAKGAGRVGGRGGGRLRRAGRWIGSHVRANTRGAWTLASRTAWAGLTGLGWAALHKLGITRPKNDQQQSDQQQGGNQVEDDRENPEPKTGDDNKPELDNTPKRRSAMGTSMTGSEFGRLLESLAGQMATAAASYDPETMPEWGGDIQHLSAALNHVASAISALHAKTNELPIEPAVSDTLVSAISLVGSAASTAEETATTFRTLHAPDLERHQAPRPAEQKWNV